ncbi:MAG: hypothetical protein CVV42_05075 [Candidatus Riflebacteria bacterium HGW-Riflebacteria-2]|jgi:transglutaminase-like putative cysteine protease/tetratricopeptide (TPR) repeat protein|nr:MAG: hypothetical protein CVV42_05075 [Candidatus Riflebacteria bacterium HGW-Riflebacteria-2]
MTKTRFLIIILFFATFSSCAASEALLSRFFMQEARVRRWQPVSISPLPEIDRSESPVETYNRGVELNNQALDAMNGKDYARATRLLAEACRLVPGEKGFWSNYLVALKNDKGREKDVINIARIVLAFNENDSQAAYMAGLAYLNDLKQPAQAIPYIEHALKAKPGDASMATALATAFEQAGYKDDAFEILKAHAHNSGNDPYPLYMLGLQYLERRDYNPAIRAFNSARAVDQKGFAHDAWVRARYYAGQLEGLENDCRDVLRRFPGVLNRQSLERILFSLEPGDFRLVETVNTTINTPSALDRLDFSVRQIPNIAGHQQLELISSEFISRGSSFAAPVTSESGKYKFSVSREILAPELALRLTYRVKTAAALGSQMQSSGATTPDIRHLSLDPLLSLDHPVLGELSRRISLLSGNYVQNATIAVASGLKYRENYEDHSVEWALANPDGCDCTEFARLLAALCLKKGIPARIATGFLIKMELINKDTSVGHAWCEVFFQGKGWVPIDPTLQSNMHWAYFGNQLSDQILFDYLNSDKRTRVSIDFVSSKPDLKVDLSNSYRISKW